MTGTEMHTAEAMSVRVTGGIAAIAADKSVGIFEKAGDLVGGQFGPTICCPQPFLAKPKSRRHTSLRSSRRPSK